MSDEKYYGYVNREIGAASLEREFRARLQAASKSTKELLDRHRSDIAATLLGAGIGLIPSDYLQDNQFVVSRGVYEAAKLITKGTP